MNPPQIIYSWISRLNKISSLYSVAIALSFFGISSFFYGFLNGFYIAITAFSVFCYLELVHSKAKASIMERSQCYEKWHPIYYIKGSKTKPNLFNMKVANQFMYEGFRFNVITVNDSNVPFEVTYPLCPRCKDNNFLVQRTKVRFPGRVKIIFKCSCGFSKISNKTEIELYKEARKLCGGT